jgi:hypothetical protein
MKRPITHKPRLPTVWFHKQAGSRGASRRCPGCHPPTALARVLPSSERRWAQEAQQLCQPQAAQLAQGKAGCCPALAAPSVSPALAVPSHIHTHTKHPPTHCAPIHQSAPSVHRPHTRQCAGGTAASGWRDCSKVLNNDRECGLPSPACRLLSDTSLGSHWLINPPDSRWTDQQHTHPRTAAAHQHAPPARAAETRGSQIRASARQGDACVWRHTAHRARVLCSMCTSDQKLHQLLAAAAAAPPPPGATPSSCLAAADGRRLAGRAAGSHGCRRPTTKKNT